jgi:hypothetical protein
MLQVGATGIEGVGGGEEEEDTQRTYYIKNLHKPINCGYKFCTLYYGRLRF